MRVLMIGGTGNFSGRITERIAAAGHEVALYITARNARFRAASRRG